MPQRSNIHFICAAALATSVLGCSMSFGSLEQKQPNFSPQRFASDTEGAELGCVSYYSAIVAQDAADTRRARRIATGAVTAVGALAAVVASVIVATEPEPKQDASQSNTGRVAATVTATAGAGVAGLGGLLTIFSSVFESELGGLTTNQGIIDSYLPLRRKALTALPEKLDDVGNEEAASIPAHVTAARDSLYKTLASEYPMARIGIIEPCRDRYSSEYTAPSTDSKTSR